jgi:hypothetical protein
LALEVEAAADVEVVFDVDIAEESRVGKSSMSARRSILRESSRAFLRLSSKGFSERVL